MKFRSLLITVCLALVPTVAFAGPFWLGATAGVGIPFGDFSDVASTGFNIGGNVDYEITSRFAVGGEVGWQTYGGNDDLEKNLSARYLTSVDVTTTAVPLLVHGKFMVPAGGPSAAYAKAALGVYRTRLEVDAGINSDDETSTDFALGLGGGWTYRIGGMRYGAEGMLHFVSTEGSSTNIFMARALIQFGGGGS